MASEAEYGDAAPLSRTSGFGLQYPVGDRSAGVNGLWRNLSARLVAILAPLMCSILPASFGGVAMAAPVKPDPAESALAEEPAEIGESGDGGAPEPPEKPKGVLPEGVAVHRHGNAELLEQLLNEPVTTVLQPGEILFKEGDPGSTMYVVRSGVLRIRSGSVVYEDVAAGGIVGEMGLVEMHMPRRATIYALQPAELIEIDEARFAQLVERRPNFAITVMRVLSRRLRYMDRRYRLEGAP